MNKPKFQPKLGLILTCLSIVFIHGLMGDGEKTWRGTDDDGRKLLPWPKTFLPSAIPRSRILTFGYDARIVNSDEIQGKVSVKSIRDHAKELVASFGHMRNQTDTTGRPIIFVCHSLGGLVCKDAIIFSTQGRDREDLVDFSQSTAGIVFMGTPHRGSAIADYASRFSGLVGSFKQTNLSLLQILRTESETLQRIHDDFCDVINVRRNGTDGHEIRVICFWEQLPSKNVGFIVPKESAVLPGYSDRGIEADHKSMTKFSSESDSGYQVLLQELKSIISKAMKRAVLPSTSRASFSKSSTPFFYVPYARNEFFVGRSSTLKQLNSWIGSPVENRERGIHKRAALHGLGGIGKTQVAIEWAYEKRQGGEHLSIFWIHSSTAERFTEAYTSIAREFQIPGHSCGGPELLRLVKEWLESSHQQHPWLMIVDNADDIEVFIEKSEDSGYQMKMHQYLPVSPNGSILFTSRSKQAAVDLTESRSLIAVTEPSPEECVELFRRRLPASFYTETDIERLANELGYLPLALSQAISYLQKKSLSVSHYLEMLGQSSEDSLMGMLQDEFTEAGRDSASGNQIPNAVARTWLVSFRAIERDNSLAIQILYLCGCFDRQEIPRSLMVEYTRSYESINAKLLEKKVGI
ncbi:P-loop containing nucleoside triphosphate hydrolase protein, partial [Dactylonectria macrodidyma]